MTRLRTSALTAALFLAALGPSCSLLHRKTPKVMTPPPPTPAPTQAPAPKPEEQVRIPAPPPMTPKSPDLQQSAPPSSQPTLPSAPQTATKRKRGGKKTPPREAAAPPSQEASAPAQPAAVPQAPAPSAPADEAALPQVPQLEQILTPEQQATYSEEIDSNIGKAEKMMAGLQGRRLTSEQKTYLARVRAFVDQAKEARKSDLFRAKNLAERASVLAEDLNRSVQ